MINFNGDSIWNLKPIDVSSVKTQVFGLLIEGEEIVAAFRTIRDQLVFTNKRFISNTSSVIPSGSSVPV